MASIELKNIEKSYGKNKVINKFDIKINDGEFVVLVGPSGCGKSTLLRMISGLESVDIGEIYLDNKLINNLIPSKREIAMVFQSYALYPISTNVTNALKIIPPIFKRKSAIDANGLTIFTRVGKNSNNLTATHPNKIVKI